MENHVLSDQACDVIAYCKIWQWKIISRANDSQQIHTKDTPPQKI